MIWQSGQQKWSVRIPVDSPDLAAISGIAPSGIIGAVCPNVISSPVAWFGSGGGDVNVIWIDDASHADIHAEYFSKRGDAPIIVRGKGGPIHAGWSQRPFGGSCDNRGGPAADGIAHIKKHQHMFRLAGGCEIARRRASEGSDALAHGISCPDGCGCCGTAFHKEQRGAKSEYRFHKDQQFGHHLSMGWVMTIRTSHYRSALE